MLAATGAVESVVVAQPLGIRCETARSAGQAAIAHAWEEETGPEEPCRGAHGSLFRPSVARRMTPAETEMGTQEVSTDAADAFLGYFRCPPAFAPFSLTSRITQREGFFRFGRTVCFGKTDAVRCAETPDQPLSDAFPEAETEPGCDVRLPFNPTEVIENLRQERYLVSGTGEHIVHRLYYLLRTLLPFFVRKRLQRYVFQRRRETIFPAWPLDSSVEHICELLMQLAIQASPSWEVPFIWFWPEGKNAAVMVTHDVEEQNGADSCEMLMDLDDSFGIKAAFQLIPEQRYAGVEALVTLIRSRGFETNIHDLDHDGRLYEDRKLFLKRVRKINEYARTYRMAGFRAGAMHRNQNWFDLLEFQYDMSVPTVSHLEPQRGGCCTVMPYFVDNLLELPLTTVQDHGLFYVLGQYSIDLWKRQVEMILAHHGLISFIVHPDYIVRDRERRVYRSLLEYISQLVEEHCVWSAFPAEIDRWWRDRSQMNLQRRNGAWRISGPGSESARLAYASIVGGRLQYRLDE